MVYLTRIEHFNAAHKLYNPNWGKEKNEEVFGKCANENWHGHNFELYVTIKGDPDPETGFISLKSKDGKDLKAQELPGLWNGAMADWNTIFLEVPIVTFNPVKSVNDLLREEHQ